MVSLRSDLKVKTDYHKIDEIPFDFQRRRMSVIVEDNQQQHLLICKGAVEEIMRLSARVEVEGKVLDVTPEHDAHRKLLVQNLNAQGFRVVAVAYKVMPGNNEEPHYEIQDESDMTLLGYLAFLDPPKDSAMEALKRLKALNVDVKILTGDNEIITSYICKQVGMPVDKILLGPQIETMSATELAEATAVTSIFAKLLPAQKEKIVHALQSKDHVVAFMGDGTGSGGINRFMWGNGFKITKNLSIGINASYLFGNMQQESSSTFPDSAYYLNFRQDNDIDVSGFYFDYGAQYTAKLKTLKLTAGAVFATSTKVNAKTDYLSTTYFTTNGTDYPKDTIQSSPGVRRSSSQCSLPVPTIPQGLSARSTLRCVRHQRQRLESPFPS